MAGKQRLLHVVAMVVATTMGMAVGWSVEAAGGPAVSPPLPLSQQSLERAWAVSAGYAGRQAPTPPSRERPFQLALVLAGPLNDLGWSSGHNLARQELEVLYNGTVATSVAEWVPYSPTAAAFSALVEILGQAQARGAALDFVITSTFDYQDALLSLAPLFPSVHFLVVEGFKGGPANMASGFAREYQPRYLQGLVAGAALRGMPAERRRAGAVMGFPVVDDIRYANAFFIGMREQCADCAMAVVFTDNWVDFDLEQYDAAWLFDAHNVSAIVHSTDTLATSFEASKRGRISFGYNLHHLQWVSSHVYASALFRWERLYRPYVDAAITGTWPQLLASLPFGPELGLFCGIDSSCVDLSPLSPLVSPDVVALVSAALQRLADGTSRVFCGQWAAFFLNSSSQDPDLCLSDFAIRTSVDRLFPEIVNLGRHPIPLTLVEISEPLRIAMQVLAGCVIALLLGSCVALIAWRKTATVRFAAWPLLLTAHLGAVLVVVAIFLMSPPPSKALCNAIVWLLSLGFTMLVGSLLAKTYRIVRMFRSSNIEVPIITNTTLFAYLAAAMAIDLLLLICLTAIDPVVAQHYTKGMQAYHYGLICNSTSAGSTAILIILVVYKVLLLIASSVLTFLSRTTAEVFNEFRHLSLAIWDLFFIFVVLVPLYVLIDDPLGAYLIACLAILLGISAAIIFLMLPKYWSILSGRDSKLDPTKATPSFVSSSLDKSSIDKP